MTKTMNRDEAIELTTVVVKLIREQVELTDDEIDRVVDIASRTIVKSLQAAGYQLPWIKNVRRN